MSADLSGLRLKKHQAALFVVHLEGTKKPPIHVRRNRKIWVACLFSKKPGTLLNNFFKQELLIR